MKTKRILVSIPNETLLKLDEYCKKNNLQRSDFIRSSVTENIENEDVFSKIYYYGKNEHIIQKYTTKLDIWLKNKKLDFHPVKYAKFGKSTLSIVEFDKDHCIYIILPEDVFTPEVKLPPIPK